MTTLSDKTAIQLDWHDEGGVVTVTPQDQDRYVVTVREVVERAHHGKQLESFMDKLKLLQRELARWLNGRSDISNAYLTVRDGGFLFLVVKNDASYSESLEDELSELDIQLANDKLINSLSVDVLALPHASAVAVDTFIDSIFVVQFVNKE